MGAGQSDLYKGTYGDTLDNIPEKLREDDSSETKGLSESDVRERYISKLSTLKPEEIYKRLQEDGCEVKPLGKGQYKGIPFDEGGGFRVSIGKDGTFIYHPEGRHHNQGHPYYKLSTGYSGTIRYDINGGILDE